MAVYLIRAGETDRVKIGKADDPPARRRALQTAHFERLRLVRMWAGGKSEETALQAQFEELRLIGDWFVFSPAMLEGGDLIEVWREGMAPLSKEALRQAKISDPTESISFITQRVQTRLELLETTLQTNEPAIGEFATILDDMPRMIFLKRAAGIPVFDHAKISAFFAHMSASDASGLTTQEQSAA